MKTYSKINRILHSLFASLMVLQLINEEFMKRPKLVDGAPRMRTDDQIFFFDMHEWVGVILLVVVGLRFMMLLGNPDEVRRLFPFISAERIKGVVADLKEVPGWFVGRIKAPSDEDCLSGFVHGLGLLLGLAMGLTGTAMFVGMDPITGTMNEFVHTLKEVHEVLGELLLYYVIGHVAMVILHQIKGHRSLQRISPLSKE